MKHYNIPIFIPHLGCPHQCIFCNQNSITGQSQPPTRQQARAAIEEQLAYLPKGEKEISFFGGTFTAIPVEQQEAYLSLAQEYVREGWVQGIRLSTRPDGVEEDTLTRLQKYGVTTIELGVQSFCDRVLQKSGRGHTRQCALNACKRVKEAGFSLGVQLMCGLPEDSLEADLDSCTLAKEYADFVRIYPVLVLRDTPLETLYRQGHYTPLSLTEAVERCVAMKAELSPVPVIRMGLCTQDLEAEQVVAGPFHPAFGELVSAKEYDTRLQAFMKGRLGEGKTLLVTAPKQAHSKVAGHKRENLLAWTQTYGFCAIRFLEGELLSFSLEQE